MLKYPLIDKKKLATLEVGDRVNRVLGTILLKGIVVKIEDNIITWTLLQPQKEISQTYRKGAEIVKELTGVVVPPEIIKKDIVPYWTFNASTGLEVDEALGWDGVERTGGYLTTS